VSSSLFRQIEASGGSADERAERLFQAAVSAFSSLTRPSRLDIQQLDDLAIPLFERVSLAGKRFAAAALSTCVSAPPSLLRRLCEEGVEVAAPLLIRSPALTDADLVSLIARFGQPYAQAIARRKNLHPAIADLLRALTRPEKPMPALRDGPAAPLPEAAPSSPPRASEAVDDVSDHARAKLRAMMRPAAGTRRLGGRTAFLRLRDAALTRRPALFHTALADSLGLWFDEACLLAGDPGGLALAFRALGLKEEEAFLLLALALPQAFGGPDEVSRFLDHYAGLEPDETDAALARRRVTGPKPSGRTVRAQ
jgi:uncharacterized protein (DUF2336 family)